MQIATSLAVVVSFYLVGCASISAEDCQKGEYWYELGWTDGSINWDRHLYYAAQCAPYGIQPDAAQYEKGREDGQWSEAHRSP
jgi:hypothetical protein